MSNPIRILVADDHPVVRDGLVAILSTQTDFDVVGEVENGTQVLTQIENLQPDIVLLDLEMPEMNGVQVLQTMAEQGDAAKVIVFTAFDTDDRILSALQAGAQGYLLKGAPRKTLFEAIRVVHAGGSLLEPIVASKLLRQVSQPSRSTEPEGESLTARELEVLQLLAQGQLNKEIALNLSISQRTVKFHVSAILGKLNAGNRTEAVAIAAQRGLVELG